MSKLIRVMVAATLGATGLIGVTMPGSDADQEIIACDATAPTVPEISVPDNPGIGEQPVAGPGRVCAELARTLVFIGHADIDNGVNAAGVGGSTSVGDLACAFESDGTPRTGGPTNYYGQSTGTCNENDNGGNFLFGGDCLMVNWDAPDQSGAVFVNGCTFAPTTGFYTRPNFHGEQGGAQGFQQLENGTPGETGLGFEPPFQASCTGSDGKGIATFLANSGTDVWSSSFQWDNSLDNLRGTIWPDADPGNSYVFDAKVQTQADPRGVNVTTEPLDVSAAGCLEKTARTNAGLPLNNRVGLNSVLVVGTATWRAETPPVFLAEI